MTGWRQVTTGPRGEDASADAWRTRREFDSLSRYLVTQDERTTALEERVGVTLTRTTNNNINNAATYTTSWEAAGYETPDGFWAVGTPTVTTIPTGQGGIYSIAAVSAWTALSDFDAAIVFSVKASGAPLEYRLRPAGTPSGHSISVTIPLAAGDTFTIQWLNLSGGTRTLNEARLDLYRVGP